MDRITAELLKEVEIIALDLPNGETGAFHCPKCRAPHEEKLFVTRKSTSLLFQCKRASCGWSGAIGRNGGHVNEPKKARNIKEYTKPTIPVSDEAAAYIKQHYQIDKATLEAHGAREVANDRGVIVLPITGISSSTGHRKRFGCQTKRLAYSEVEGTKAITYVDDPSTDPINTFISPSPKELSSIVVVEDILSAYKIGLFTGAIALLGTNLSEDLAIALSKYDVPVIIALDPDAAKASRKIYEKYACIMPMVQVFLDKDPKDTEYSVLERAIRNAENKFKI